MIIFPATACKVKHTVTVFTDVDCGYCRKMQSQISDYNKAGITVRFLAFPRSGADTPYYYKAAGVWCAKDRREALASAMRGDEVDFKKCDNPVKAHLAVAERIGVSGTPTMVLENGAVVPGYMPPDRLRQALDQIAARWLLRECAMRRLLRHCSFEQTRGDEGKSDNGRCRCHDMTMPLRAVLATRFA